MIRYVLASILWATILSGSALAEEGELIGQLGENARDTGQRSSANLSQIGKRTVETGGLVDQIDPSLAPAHMEIDESAVSELLPADLAAGECALSANQQAITDYLRTEGRVFENTCEMLAWLSAKDSEKPSERDLFNVIFGPEAQRQKKAELERLELEQQRAQAQARLLEAINGNQGGGR